MFYLWNFETVNSEIFIKAKINNQIITNFDVKNEKNYLLALNPSLRNLPVEEINRYATDSLINENIKRINANGMRVTGRCTIRGCKVVKRQKCGSV